MFEQRDEDGTFLPGARAAAPPSLAQGRATEESKQKKGSITEEDVCTLLQRYSAATILALLKEVHQVVDVKLDWQELVKKTDTGIKSAREYQMLWRHLAYRKHLIEKIDPLDQPLDDDSDLEYELEACPPASAGDALEASNCVKTLTCRSTNKSRLPNNASVEVQRASAVPSVHKPSQLSQAAGTSGEGLNANGPTSNNQRKRKSLSEEDRELIAPVAARKVEFKGEKNSTQRTQRAPAKKKQAVGGANTAGTLLSAKQEATRHAIKMALKDGPTTVGNGHAGSTNAAKIASPKGNFPITRVAAPSSQPNSSPITTAPSSGKPAPIASSSKLCPQKKAPPPPPPPLPPSSVSANSIQAAAVAAGARIISSSDAASLLKVTQSKNAMHIKGGPPVKTSAAGISSSLPPNVHLMTGSSTPTTVAAGTSSSVLSAQQPKGSAAPPVSQLPKMRATSTVAMERSSSNATTTARAHEDVASVSQCLPKAPLVKCQASSPSTGDGPAKQTASVDESQCTMNRDVDGMEGKDITCKPVVEGPHSKDDGEKPCAVQRNCIPSVNGTHGISPTAVSDGGAEKMEVSSERLHGDLVI